jgi:hypothetical protein
VRAGISSFEIRQIHIWEAGRTKHHSDAEAASDSFKLEVLSFKKADLKAARWNRNHAGISET